MDTCISGAVLLRSSSRYYLENILSLPLLLHFFPLPIASGRPQHFFHGMTVYVKKPTNKLKSGKRNANPGSLFVTSTDLDQFGVLGHEPRVLKQEIWTGRLPAKLEYQSSLCDEIIEIIWKELFIWFCRWSYLPQNSSLGSSCVLSFAKKCKGRYGVGQWNLIMKCLCIYTLLKEISLQEMSLAIFFLWKSNKMTLPTTFRVMRAHSYCPAFLTLHMYFPASLDCRDMICKDASPARKLDVKETRPFCSSFRSS